MKKLLFFALLASLFVNVIQYWIIQHTSALIRLAKLADHFEDIIDFTDSISGLF